MASRRNLTPEQVSGMMQIANERFTRGAELISIEDKRDGLGARLVKWPVAILGDAPTDAEAANASGRWEASQPPTLDGLQAQIAEIWDFLETPRGQE